MRFDAIRGYKPTTRADAAGPCPAGWCKWV